MAKKRATEGDTYVCKVWGYVMVKVGRTWKRQHRHLMELHLGRSLGLREHVHHKNGDRADNRLENLEVMTQQEHTRLHTTGRVWRDESKAKARASAQRVGADPAERQRRSERARAQWAAGNIGTTPEGTAKTAAKLRGRKRGPLPAAWRRALSEGQQRRWADPAERRKQAERARTQRRKEQ
jgi:hypothetical protein